MKIEKFTKQTLKVLRNEMTEALKKAGVENVEFVVGNMRFSDSEVSIKVEAKVKGAVTHEDRELEAAIKLYGLSRTNSFGETLCGYRPRATKYKYVYSTRSGKKYQTSHVGVMQKFGAPATGPRATTMAEALRS